MSKPTAKIISWNNSSLALCASAAKISTTPGNAEEIFLATNNKPGNSALIQKVLKSGHQSILEHAVFSIAFWNVSVFVEQFLIECRLASFTVKSRRYVDFSEQGFFIPPELSEEDRQLYLRYMTPLFEGYSSLLEMEIPKEDARFLLPYSFCSSFYCTLNARELFLVLDAMRFGRGSGSAELDSLANQLLDQLQEMFPIERPSPLNRIPCADAAKNCSRSLQSGGPEMLGSDQLGQVQMLQAAKDPDSILDLAHRVFHPEDSEAVNAEKLIHSMRPRELEQLTYTFSITGISLASITHLVRHRMQSVLIPPIESVDHRRFVLPETISKNPEAKALYEKRISDATQMLPEIYQREALRRNFCYFALSGNVLDVMTTMNARELLLFFRLRSCNRAQWEIRNISNRMLALLREDYPSLFDRYGPSCVVTGSCPEGRLSCGKIKEVQETFMNWRRES